VKKFTDHPDFWTDFMIGCFISFTFGFLIMFAFRISQQIIVGGCR
jgi:hypothetical protein